MTIPNSDNTPELPHRQANSPEELASNEPMLDDAALNEPMLDDAILNDMTLIDGLLPEIFDAPRATREATERIMRRINGSSSEASNNDGPTSDSNDQVTSPTSRFTTADLERAIQSAQRDRRSRVDISRARKATKRRRAILTMVSATGLAASLMTTAFLVWKPFSNTSNQSFDVTDSKKSTLRNSNLTDSSSSENRTTSDSEPSITRNTSDLKNESLTRDAEGMQRVASSNTPSDSEIASPLGSNPTKSSISLPSAIANDSNRSAMNAPNEPATALLGSEFDAGLVGNGLINTAAISVINHQFEDMWKEGSFSTSSPSSSNFRVVSPNALSEQHVASRSDLLVNRIASLLVGRSATSSELEAIRQENLLKTRSLSENHSQWVDAIAQRWLASDEFSQTWGNALSSFYRGGYPVDAADRQQARDFDGWLTEQVKLNASLRDIQKQVLGGLSDKSHPARFLVVHWSKLTQAAPPLPTSASSEPASSAPASSEPASTPPENSAIANLSGSQQAKARDGKTAPQSWIGLNEQESTALTGVTNLFLHITDNPMLACSQCHQQSQPLNTANQTSYVGGEVAVITGRSTRPVSYGSVSALLLNVLESNQRELFTKDEEDRAVKLTPAFPNGKRASASDTTDSLLTTWVEEGSHSQRGLVNHLWKSFFGVPLVAPEEQHGPASTSSREELLNYISQQASDQNVPVRQLVYWMLHASPTLQPEVALDIQNVIALSQADLRTLRTRIELQHVMIHRPINASSIDEFVKQLLPVQQEIRDRALLAQPSSRESSTANKQDTADRTAAEVAAKANGLTKDSREAMARQQLGYAQLIYAVPSVQVADLAKRFSESTLSQSELIDHTYGVVRGRKPSSAERAIWKASRLKEFAKPDAALRILSGVSAFEYPTE